MTDEAPLIHDPAAHRLGKLEPKPPRLMIRDFVDVERVAFTAPRTVNNSHPHWGMIPLAMYLNDREGDCTFATIGNARRVVSRGRHVLQDSDIQTGYVAVTAKENGGQGYDPATGANDNGCVELDVLDYWATVGVGDSRAAAHAGVAPKDREAMRAVAYLCGFVYLGVALAVEQQRQATWDFVPGSTPGSWGGHAVPLFDVWDDAATGQPRYRIGTWGAYKQVTQSFVDQQCDEAHAVVTQDWLDEHQGDPNINAAALQQRFRELTPEQ